ncbi:MAG: tetraacyldisaccharide 4'-kinase [Bacteroidia bacterium]|nr:tetraacyldisaccharide 4'-kinase [Bacteroidia bacterium]
MQKARYILLFPVSFIYGIITAIRNLFYDWGFLKSNTFKEHVICVGNLSVGGTGKTPHIEYLINLLKNEKRIATLSRGYKRKTKGFMIAFDENTADEVGDEPKQFKTKFKDIVVAVDSNRVNGIKKLNKIKDKPDLYLLDDAFQHRSVKAGLNILLTDFNDLFVNDSMLPGGNLREYKSGYKRADIIIFTKTPERVSNLDMKVYSKEIQMKPYQKIFFSWLKYGDLYYYSDFNFKIDIPKQLFKFNVLVLTGIANPGPLVTYVKEYANQTVQKSFGDHHDFSVADIGELRKLFNTIAGENKLIVTTEKDYMRLLKPELMEALTGLPLFILPIEIDFKKNTEEFNETILRYARANTFYHSKYSAGNK